MQSPIETPKNQQVSQPPIASHSFREEQTLQPDLPPRPAETNAEPARRPRGFAAVDRTLVREMARKGGKAAHAAGTAHEFTSEEARHAGRKGGQAAHAKRRKAAEQKAQE
jgi:general stress protein YciG